VLLNRGGNRTGKKVNSRTPSVNRTGWKLEWDGYTVMEIGMGWIHCDGNWNGMDTL